METRAVECDGVHVVVSQATTLSGMRRTRLQIEGRDAQEEDVDRRLLRLYTYPDVIAATVEVEGLDWPLDFETFLGLPDALVAQWEQAVYDLNPHWLPRPAATPEEKKESLMPSTSA
jgi:hypothetical protein